MLNSFVPTKELAITNVRLLAVGDHVVKGEILADGPSMELGELST